MLRIYRIESLPHMVLEIKWMYLISNGMEFSCHLLTGRNVKDLSPEKFIVYRFSKKISVRLYRIGR